MFIFKKAILLAHTVRAARGSRAKETLVTCCIAPTSKCLCNNCSGAGFEKPIVPVRATHRAVIAAEAVEDPDTES